MDVGRLHGDERAVHFQDSKAREGGVSGGQSGLDGVQQFPGLRSAIRVPPSQVKYYVPTVQWVQWRGGVKRVIVNLH